MASSPSIPPDEPSERTPKGYKVRVPKRSEFFGNLKKIAARHSKTAPPAERQKQSGL